MEPRTMASRALAAFLLLLSAASFAAIQTRDIDVRESTGFAFFDSVAGRQPTWAVMSNGSPSGDAAFGGTLYSALPPRPT